LDDWNISSGFSSALLSSAISSRSTTRPSPRIALTIFVIWHFAVFFALWPRLRDCGMPGMWVILSLVPVIFVFLAIALIFRAPEFRFEESGDKPPQTT
jgi:hypothetical protein